MRDSDVQKPPGIAESIEWWPPEPSERADGTSRRWSGLIGAQVREDQEVIRLARLEQPWAAVNDTPVRGRDMTTSTFRRSSCAEPPPATTPVVPLTPAAPGLRGGAHTVGPSLGGAVWTARDVTSDRRRSASPTVFFSVSARAESEHDDPRSAGPSRRRRRPRRSSDSVDRPGRAQVPSSARARATTRGTGEVEGPWRRHARSPGQRARRARAAEPHSSIA